MRKAVNATMIRNKKILLVKKNEIWILPGGKPKPCDEDSSINCLHREIAEELHGVNMINIYYYKTFQGITPHTGDTLEARVYFVEFKGNEKITNSEISKSKWIGIEEISEYNISNITNKVIDSLHAEDYL